MTPRITPGTLRQLGPAAYAFSRIAGRVTGTEPPAIFTTLGRARRTYWAWMTFAGALMPFGHLPRRESELVILRVAHLRGSAYERAHHELLGRRAGLSSLEIERSARDELDPEWGPRDRAILDTVDVFVRTDDVDDRTWTVLRDHLSERESIELLLLIGNYRMLAGVLHVLRVSPDRPRAARGGEVVTCE